MAAAFRFGLLVEHVLAVARDSESGFSSSKIPRLDAAAQMLDEVALDQRIDNAYDALSIFPLARIALG